MSEPLETKLWRKVELGRDSASDVRAQAGFWVLPQRDGADEEIYTVVGPTGVPLYTFTDVRDAVEEAAELNGQAGAPSSPPKRKATSSSLG